MAEERGRRVGRGDVSWEALFGEPTITIKTIDVFQMVSILGRDYFPMFLAWTRL